VEKEKQIRLENLIKISDVLWEIPQEFRQDMRVPARVFANQHILEDVFEDRSLWQLVNVATLPGIQKFAFAMPDIHQGYGFPIGGVAATAIDEGGVISPGGIGYDINCGVRLLRVSMTADELKPYLADLATEIFHAIPSGVGRGGKLKLNQEDLAKVLRDGAHRMVELGYGTQGDLEYCEETGRMTNADATLITTTAKKRGADQLGTLGSGNHFLEIQRVDEIFDEKSAQVYGLEKNMVTVMIHCGSRGLGHQTCTDHVNSMMPKMGQWGIQLPDRELVCAPFKSPEGQDYFNAMAAAANFAWANRHLIGQWVRDSWKKVIGDSVKITTLYDVSHNIGKRESHEINGKIKQVIMHRKGATRAFGPGRPEVPSHYQPVGQPVLIPGTMGTSSYVLAGTKESMEVGFGTSCHGAGRRMSRVQAKKTVRGSTLRQELEAQGIIIRSDSNSGLAEEAPIAYKDVEDVVSVVDKARLAKKVVRLKPLAVIKGG
jgi:tRNA-splicing ligase RtcB